MGRQSKLRAARRVLRGMLADGACEPDDAAEAYRFAKANLAHPVPHFPGSFRGIDRSVDVERYADPGTATERTTLRVSPDGSVSSIDVCPPGFHVGMSIKGPPEMFGLPPDDPNAPPPMPCVVTAVDYETGTITVESAKP